MPVPAPGPAKRYEVLACFAASMRAAPAGTAGLAEMASKRPVLVSDTCMSSKYFTRSASESGVVFSTCRPQPTKRSVITCRHSRPGRDGIEAPGVGERRVHVVEVLHEVGLREWRGLLNLPAPAHEEIGDHLCIGVFVEVRLELDLDVRNGSLCTNRIENGLAHTGVLECHHSAAHGAVFFRVAELTFLDDDLAARVLAAGSPLRLRQIIVTVITLVTFALALLATTFWGTLVATEILGLAVVYISLAIVSLSLSSLASFVPIIEASFRLPLVFPGALSSLPSVFTSVVGGLPLTSVLMTTAGMTSVVGGLPLTSVLAALTSVFVLAALALSLLFLLGLLFLLLRG
mmetsp:Transcript_90513/g.290149  ORF Transcript_90513/g.290149 Transcript_90513/m.290149 type:complete len:346 (+) Transcript_90513:166-1203(+)